jgi:acetyl-CoA C-acetyltransferase
VRTAIGDYGGALKDLAPTELSAQVIREAVKRAKVDAKEVGACVIGNVIHTEAKDMYFSRVAALKGGLADESTALTVNRLCGSGLQAIVSASQMILLGDSDIAVGGGAESMSRGAYVLPSLRWGQRMSDGNVIDMMVGALTDPFETVHMGITAENIAEKWKITREQQDEFAVESHRRAINAIEKGYFKEQILPVELKTRKGTTVFDRDEHPRADASMEGMAKLRAAFKKEGTVTAANASGINDGAAAVVVMSDAKAKELKLTPLAKIRAAASAGVDPSIMGMGPWPASEKALKKAGLRREEIDLWELNEAFAGQSLGVLRELHIPKNRVNVNGGAIALGHPIGASGARVLVTLLHAMEDRDARLGVASLCIGGGQGISMIVERG